MSATARITKSESEDKPVLDAVIAGLHAHALFKRLDGDAHVPT
jgi:hypothetical protein